MMEPIERLVRFMRTLDAARLAEAFVAEPVILENFAPYVFRGPNGLRAWTDGFREHARELSELVATFGPAQDFDRTGDRVYFVLPTTWRGKARGKPFVEEGGWSFVLKEIGPDWRIEAYAWAVTALRPG
jgi:hypothetical protein